MKNPNTLSSVFLSFFKTGLFTFGGGYAMISLLERECVERRGWIDHDEFLSVTAIAESTPGPIAVNMATYIGYKLKRLPGALLATLAVCLPSFVIILAISQVFDRFMQLEYVRYAFRGIQACVCYLVLSAGFKLLGKLPKSALNIILCVLTVGVMMTVTLLSSRLSPVLLILFGAAVGVCVWLFSRENKKGKGEKQ